VACSDRITAAITSDGALFTWGDGTPGNLGYAQAARQFVPRQVAGGLAGQHATQVSCGPFHAAAITGAGDLLTWGSGLCGKLGHPSSSYTNVTEPRRVEALAGCRVLSVACGVWHTAAVAGERHSRFGILHTDEAGAIAKRANSSDFPVRPASSDVDARTESADLPEPGPAEGGWLFTWGGVFTWTEQQRDKKGAVTAQPDSNRGCLGLGDTLGRELPTRVNGDMATALVRQVAVGASFTVAITVDGKVYQMGATGASGRAKWEGAKSPELVRMLMCPRAGP